MKYEIYFGYTINMQNRKKITECDTIEEAKTLLEKYISENHDNCKIGKIIKKSETHFIYDYGSFSNYYEIVGVNKHLEVVAGIICNENKILCMQRDDGKYKYVSFKWEFPGGKIEPGETNEMALKRELKEEMEMDVDILDHFCDVEYVYPDFSIKMYCYDVKAKSKNFVMNVHKDYKWLTKDELNTLDWAPADQPVVAKIMEGI